MCPSSSVTIIEPDGAALMVSMSSLIASQYADRSQGGGGVIGGDRASPRLFAGGFRMMRFLAMILVSVMVLGCGPAHSTHRRVKQVGWVELVNHYRDNRDSSDREYLNQTIQVYLPRKSFRCEHGRVEAYFGMSGRPCLVFESCQADDSKAALVTGVCRGIVHDGRERANNIQWFVLVEDCVVTELN